MRHGFGCVLLAVGWILSAVAGASGNVIQSLDLNDKGLHINAGTLGQFTLEYPQLVGADQKVVHKIIEKQAAGKKATVKYDGGGRIDLEVKAGGEVVLTFGNIPQDVKQYACTMMIDFSLSNGGMWQVDSQAEQAFPREKPAKPHLSQGQARKFLLKGYDGRSFSITMPEYSYLQLTDNREWNWKIFALRCNAPFNRDARTQRLVIAEGDAAAVSAPRPQVDQFGQDARVDYPDKVKSLEELKADVESEKAYYAGLNPPQFDPYGGLPDSGAKLGLNKTGFFHVEKKGEKWFLVDPAGNAFFQLGVCSFHPLDHTYVTGREQIFAWIPPRQGEFAGAWHPQDANSVSFHLANQIRKYGKPFDRDEWFVRMIERVRRFGFNSGGAFSAPDNPVFTAASFPYVLNLPTQPWDKLPRIPGVRETFDPFDAKNREQYLKNCAASLPRHADDPLLIGYFLINEPLYEDLPKVLPTLNGKWACKRALVKMLQDKYQSVEALNQAWKLQAASFDELNDRGLPVTTQAAADDVQAFIGQFFETYFQLIVEGFKKYDPNHMLIGNRLQPGTANNEQLCRISGKYLDIFSVNYYTYYLDPEFTGRLYKWTGGRPMILSEFYWNSPSDSGLPGGVRDVSSQEERGLAYRNYVEKAASLGYIVGIQWFTNVDQPVTGVWFSKYTGENGNCGLFSVADRPWKAMIAQMIQTNYGIYQVMLGERPPFVYANPKFSQVSAGRQIAKISRAAGPMKIDGQADGWPALPPEIISSKRLVNGASAGGVEATFKLCWDDQNLYVLASVTDATPMKNGREGKDLWSGDGVEVFVGADKLDQPGTLLFTDRQVLLGAGSATGASYVNHANQQVPCTIAVVPSVDGKGYTLEAAIPFTALGFVPRAGQEIRFDLGINDSADGKVRLRQLMWNGTDRNSSDRGMWGRAVFVP